MRPLSARAERRLLAKARAEEPAKAAKAEKERTCGTCAACCVTHQVDALGKPGGAPCLHLKPESEAGAGRCSVYADRPADCVEWACVWRRGYLLPHERPDRVGVVVDVVEFQPQVLELAEWRPGGLEEKAARDLRARLEQCGGVVVKPLPTDGRRHLPVVALP